MMICCLKLHVDEWIEDGKAEWVQPGEAITWARPAFVVDQEGKGLLVRPVVDYRYVNS